MRMNEFSTDTMKEDEIRCGYWVCREARKRRIKAKSPVIKSERSVDTAERKVCSPPRKEVFVGREEGDGFEARS